MRDIELWRKDESYEIWIPDEAGDLSLERDALKRRKRMFVDFFGVGVVLRQGRPEARK